MMAVYSPNDYYDLWGKIEKLMSEAQCNPTQMSLISQKLKSSDVSGLDVVIELIDAGIKNKDLIRKIVKLVEGNKDLYCLVELEQLRIFNSVEEFREVLKELKKKRKRNYYEGSFLSVTTNMSLYQYEQTEKASDAAEDDFQLQVQEVELSEIFLKPVIPMICIDARIICVTRSGLERVKMEGRMEGIKRALDVTRDEATRSKIQKLSSDDLSLSLRASLPIVETIPNEDAQNNSIIDQIKKYAEKNAYYVSTNKSISPDLQNVKKISKHASSRPDLIVLKKGAGLFVCVGQDDIHKQLEAMSLSGEAKTSKSTSKDPIGQLMGNMNKTLGDITYRAVKRFGRCMDQVDVFGLYFIAQYNKCRVYKAIVKPNQLTKMLVCKKEIEISDAVNGAFSEMSRFYF